MTAIERDLNTVQLDRGIEPLDFLKRLLRV